MSLSPGALFRAALVAESPLQIVGTVNAYSAIMAKRAGYRAIYLSGGACANASYGLPDLGFTTLDDVVADAARITHACDVPLLVDIDTGWEETSGVVLTIQRMQAAGVAAVQMEDQVSQKRCGHRPNKQLVSSDHMVERIKAAVSARIDNDFFILARTDAFANEGMEAAIERAQAYVAAGADGIFIEALTELSQYETFCAAVDVPVLANMTEFGKTPLYSLSAFKSTGIAMVLYPLTALRAMNQAAWQVYQTVRKEGTQEGLLAQMQTREELYDMLDYHAAEQKIDQLDSSKKD